MKDGAFPRGRHKAVKKVKEQKLVRDDRRKELFAHLEAFLHIVFLSYSWPPDLTF